MREDVNGGSGDTRRRRLQQYRCSMEEMAVFVRRQQRPAPEKQNAYNFRWDERMMRTVGRKYTRAIETVASGGDAAEIQDNRVWRREAVKSYNNSSVYGGVGWWGRWWMSMSAEKRDDYFYGSKEAKLKARAYWMVKLRRCPTQRNNNGRTADQMSQSPSHVKKSNNEAARPSYQTEYCGFSDGFLTGVLYIVCQQQTAAAAEADSHNG